MAEPFEDILSGQKKFELRYNDRGFVVGDTLYLREWNHYAKLYSGRSLSVKVNYILSSFAGLQEGYVIMGIERC